MSIAKMQLSGVVKGKQAKSWRILLYGTEGVGKSTFASQCPAPIFLGAEDGTAHLDVQRFPSPSNWDDILSAVKILADDKHEFKTLVVDTVDWVEPLLWAHICKRDKKQDIEDYGYGKGYQCALDEWRTFLAALEKLREKSINVLLLGHSHLKTFKNPTDEDFDRYELKLHAKAAGLLKEWSDAVLFADYETMSRKDAKTKRIRGVSTGARYLYTQRTAAYDAKNRFNFQDVMAFSYPDIETAMRGSTVSHEVLVAEITRKAALLEKSLEAQAIAAIGRAGSDTTKLTLLNTWVNSQQQKQQPTTTQQKDN